MITHVESEKQNKTKQMNKESRSRPIDAENKLMAAKGEGAGMRKEKGRF